MAYLKYGNKQTMHHRRIKYIAYNPAAPNMDVDWLNEWGWKRRPVKIKHRNCNDKIEWYEIIGDKIFTVRKYGRVLFKIKWVLRGQRQPCCNANKGRYWNCNYLKTWAEVLGVIFAIKENEEAVEHPATNTVQNGGV